jgi:pyruvate,water dikinase
MTWSIVRAFLSGRGGLGLMYRDLGFDPDPALDDVSIYDLICGRPYCNLSREPRMQYRRMPFEHPFEPLKREPSRALYPQPVLNPARASWRFWVFLPFITLGLFRSAVKLRGISRGFAETFRRQIVPRYLQALDAETTVDLTQERPEYLLERLRRVIQLTLHDFARDGLKPTVLASLAMGSLERGLTRSLGPERARSAIGELMMGARPDPEADLPAAVEELAVGRLERETFVKRFGHRGNQEMELSQPRWAENPAAVDRLIAAASKHATSQRPEGVAAWERIGAEAKLSPSLRAALEQDLHSLHTYLGLRETAKHYLMQGFAQVRRILLEINRRFQLGGGIFFLTPEELPKLIAGDSMHPLIRDRRRRRAIALSLEVPQVIFSDDLEAIGRPVEIAGADALQGVPLSAGVAEGEALVLAESDGAVPPSEPYILVCPSTDPAWVPLFVNARALVMETGGVLSHGAIVAREFGLPAVAGLPDVHRRLRTGQKLRVDGNTGKVMVLKS